MKLAEKILLALIFIACLLKILHFPGADESLLISFSTIAGIYFPLGFLFFSNVGVRQLFKGQLKSIDNLVIALAFITGLGLSILCTGILFRLLHFPGSAPMLYSGLLISAIMLIVHLVRQRRAPTDAGKISITRLVLFSVVGLVIIF